MLIVYTLFLKAKFNFQIVIIELRYHGINTWETMSKDTKMKTNCAK